ncbi:MAG: hypothetical protein Kow00108_03500 [Calditrichia bacterium]
MNNQHYGRNLFGYLWHALFFSITFAFTDYNSVLPSLILKAGGSFYHIGLLTFISIGFPLFFQILFMGYITGAQHKKKFLLLGIHLRIIALAGIGYSIYRFINGRSDGFVLYIYLWLIIFSMSGALANLPYNHLAGVSFKGMGRKVYLFRKQIVTALGMVISAILVGIFLRHFDFPVNYMTLFFAASIMLFIASLGFWLLREEKVASIKPAVSVATIFKSIPLYLKESSNLLNLVIIANLSGVFIGLIPFLMGVVKNEIGISAELVGKVVFFQYMSMILSSILWRKIMHSKGFKGLLMATSGLAFILPLITLGLLSLSGEKSIYVLFFLLGAIISAYKIGMEGSLLEISSDENRIIFTGIFGALNILGSLIPLVGGFLFEVIPYTIIFLFISLLALLNFKYIRRLDCPIDHA